MQTNEKTQERERLKALRKKYHRKILVLRLQQLILLGIIAFLLGGKFGKFTKASGNLEIGLQKNVSKNEPDIQTEYEWLQDHKFMFEENKIERAKGNDGLIDFLYKYGTDDYVIPKEISLTKEEKEQNIPVLFQWDERWGYNSYGDSNIGLCGCGPVCLAMIAEGLTRDENITPVTVAEYATAKDHYLKNTGTKWTLFPEFAKDYGLICRNIGKNSITYELQKGNPLICSMSRGKFTDGGHFIVVHSLDNNEVRVNDPNNLELSSKEWNLSDFLDEIRSAWAFGKRL